MTGLAPEKIAYRMEEAAEASGLCRATLYKEIAAGRLSAFKAAGRRLILRSELERYLITAALQQAA